MKSVDTDCLLKTINMHQLVSENSRDSTLTAINSLGKKPNKQFPLPPIIPISTYFNQKATNESINAISPPIPRQKKENLLPILYIYIYI
jgi:hypothetical protein